MSLISHPSVHLVCIAQDVSLAENAHLTTRLGGSFGKQAFREIIGGLMSSTRTWAAAGQPVQTAKQKGKLWQKQPRWKDQKCLHTKKACLYVCCQCHQSITTCMARERERKWRLNEMSLEEGTNTSTPWDQAVTLSAFQPGEAAALSDPKQELPLCSSRLSQEGLRALSLHIQAPWWFSNSAGNKILSTWRLATTRQGYRRQWDTDCFLDTQQEAVTNPAFNTVGWVFFCIADLKGLCSSTTCYDRAAFQAQIPCTL